MATTGCAACSAVDRHVNASAITTWVCLDALPNTQLHHFNPILYDKDDITTTHEIHVKSLTVNSPIRANTRSKLVNGRADARSLLFPLAPIATYQTLQVAKMFPTRRIYYCTNMAENQHIPYFTDAKCPKLYFRKPTGHEDSTCWAFLAFLIQKCGNNGELPLESLKYILHPKRFQPSKTTANRSPRVVIRSSSKPKTSIVPS
jgi:hypothetical protein